LTIGLVASVLALYGASLQQMTVEQTSAAATEIVRGTVTGTYTALSGRTVFTHYKIQVVERLKGPNNPVVDMALPGGVFGGVRQTFPGVPALTVGGQYLLFLWTGASGPTQPVGFSQGVFSVAPDGTGVTTASRPATGEILVDTQGRVVNDRPVSIALSTMRSKVVAAMAGGKGK